MTERCYSGSDAATLIHREPGEPPPSARQPTRPSTLLNLLHFHFHSHPQNHPTPSDPTPIRTARHVSHIHPPIANTTTNTPPPPNGHRRRTCPGRKAQAAACGAFAEPSRGAPVQLGNGATPRGLARSSPLPNPVRRVERRAYREPLLPTRCPRTLW